jgi:antitoxin (DNA-binding transcriptional repressor) of toxin-antitoxin stability system
MWYMIEVTLTELRKDLFRLIDQVAETGETLRVRRKGRTIDLTPVQSEKSVREMTPQERFDRWLAKCETEGPKPCPDDLDTYKDHWVWDPNIKFRDL